MEGRSPAGGGVLALPSGLQAIAEPIAEDDVYVVRRNSRSARDPRPRLELRVLGTEPPEVRLDGEPLRLRPRHVEMLTILMLHRGFLTPRSCAPSSTATTDTPPASASRCRARCACCPALESEGYGLGALVASDIRRVRALLDRGAVREAAEAYPGPLLPASVAPCIEAGARRARRMDAPGRHHVRRRRRAVAGCGRPRANATCSPGQRLLAALAYTDPRRSRAVARTRALRRELGL